LAHYGLSLVDLIPLLFPLSLLFLWLGKGIGQRSVLVLVDELFAGQRCLLVNEAMTMRDDDWAKERDERCDDRDFKKGDSSTS
jgi:hypothetical protein